MGLYLGNRAAYIDKIQLAAKMDFALDEANLNLDSGKYYTSESSEIRYKIYCDFIESPDGATVKVENCAAKKLFSLCPTLFFFPEEGLQGIKKAELVNYLYSFKQKKEVPSFPEGQMFDFTPAFHDQIHMLIEFLNDHEVVYAI